MRKSVHVLTRGLLIGGESRTIEANQVSCSTRSMLIEGDSKVRDQSVDEHRAEVLIDL